MPLVGLVDPLTCTLKFVGRGDGEDRHGNPAASRPLASLQRVQRSNDAGGDGVGSTGLAFEGTDNEASGGGAAVFPPGGRASVEF